MSWITNWIRRQESRCVKQWLTDIYFELVDGRQLSLTAGPRVDVDLNQIWSSNEIAERYLKLSPVFVITNQGEVVPRAQWREHRFASGDKVDIVRAIGGG